MYLLINGKPTQFRAGDRITYDHAHGLIYAVRDHRESDTHPDSRLKWLKVAHEPSDQADNKVYAPLLGKLSREQASRLLEQLFRAFTGLDLTKVRSDDCKDFYLVVGPESDA